jgi:hypothetical protein
MMFDGRLVPDDVVELARNAAAHFTPHEEWRARVLQGLYDDTAQVRVAAWAILRDREAAPRPQERRSTRSS